jgi:hypothetical protein
MITRQQAHNEADAKKHQQDTEVAQSSEIKVKKENSTTQEEIDHHPTTGRMTDKLINTLLSNNIDKVPKDECH